MEPCQVLHRDAEQQLASTSTILRRLHRIPSKPREQEEWRSGAPAAPPPPSTATGENKMSSLTLEFPATMLLMRENFCRTVSRCPEGEQEWGEDGSGLFTKGEGAGALRGGWGEASRRRSSSRWTTAQNS